jgi:hypothetical protein
MILATFLSGVSMATFAASGLFFIKFWRASGDRFFMYFGIACGLISLERFVSIFIHETLEPIRNTLEGPSTWVYLIRLFAFGLILIAVVKKNRSRSRKERA